jgi:glycosyltransferase involved in cell wall biosynthesis
MKTIAIIGSRGIPAGYGGFETFTEVISVFLSQNGYRVIVVNDADHKANVEGITILNTRITKAKRPLRFYRDSLRLASAHSPLVLALGVGGALFYPRILRRGVAVITNIDGLEHLRKKYSPFKRSFVRVLQWLAFRLSTHLVADSDAVRKYWIGRNAIDEQFISTIAYGAFIPDASPVALEKFDLTFRGYYLIIARLVPENNIAEITDAFLKSNSEKKLVIVADINNPYGEELKSKSDEKIIFTGAIFDRELLGSLRTNCFAYLHGHTVGGTNPSLVEAMAASCLCICHDNPFNRETTRDSQIYFLNESLAAVFQQTEKLSEGILNGYRNNSRKIAEENYSWEKIGAQYMELFERFMQTWPQQ